MERKIEKLVEKIIEIRIDNILEKGKLNIETKEEIKNINKNIINEKKIKNKKKPKKIKKNDIPKEENIMNPYTLFVKDATNVMNGKNNLNYLNKYTKKIKDCKKNKRSEQFKYFSIIWNNLEDETKNKYKNLCKNRDFSNIKYDEILSSSKYNKK